MEQLCFDARGKKLFRRDKLECLLDGAKDRSVILINAPSGAGKSTFVREYLRGKNKPYLWMDFSITLSDPVAFFETLTQEASELIDRVHELPIFSGEYIGFINEFSAQFFRKLLGLMPEESYIVFDDLHNLNTESPVNFAIETLIRGFPCDKKLFLMSRMPFNVSLCDWEVEKKILRLDMGHFKLSEEEVVEFFKEVFGAQIPREEAKYLLSRTEGLIAKLLLYEDYSKGVSGDILSLLDLNIPETHVKKLVYVAELPKITRELVKDIGADIEVMNLLKDMCLKGLFVFNYGDLKDTFTIHDILRDYLRNKAPEIIGDSYREHLQKVALALYRRNYREEAINILHRIGDIEGIFSIFIDSLLELIYSGRLYSLQAFIDILKNTPYSENPWVLYAQAVVNKFTNPANTVRLLENCIHKFKSEDNEVGEKLAIGELFDVIQYWGEDFAIAGKFLYRAQELILRGNNPTPSDLMLLAYTGIVHLLYRGDSKQATACFDAIERVLEEAKEPIEGDMATYLSYIKLYSAIVYDTAGNIPKAEIAFEEAKYLFENAVKTHQNIFMYNFLASMHETFIGRFKPAVSRIRDIKKEFYSWEIVIHEEHLLTREFEALLCDGRLKEADKVAEKLRDIKTGSSFSRGMTLQLMAQYYLMKNRLSEAVRCAEESIELFEKIHGEPFVVSTKSLLSIILMELGKFKDAESILMETLLWAKRRGAELQRFTTLMYIGLLYARMGLEERAKGFLSEALRLAKECTFKATYNGYPALLSEILSYAIRWDIEPEYVSQLISYHGLKPPSGAISEDSWVWKLKIYTFGKLRVVIGDRELTSRDWKGNKAFTLLKALLAFGGRDVPVDEIIPLIWSNQSKEKASKSFEFTLRKLRSILSSSETDNPAVILKNRRLSLNHEIAWTDMWEFERLCELIQESSGASKERLASRLRHIYTGRFMETESESWLTEPRNRIHSAFESYSTSTQIPLR